MTWNCLFSETYCEADAMCDQFLNSSSCAEGDCSFLQMLPIEDVTPKKRVRHKNPRYEGIEDSEPEQPPRKRITSIEKGAYIHQYTTCKHVKIYLSSSIKNSFIFLNTTFISIVVLLML